MKRSFYLLLFSLLSAVTASADVLFETTLATEDDFSQWTVVDVNKDGSTWGFNAEATPSPVFYNYNSSNAADDWLISPAITVPAGAGTLMVEYTYCGSSYGEAMDVYYGASATVEAMTEKGAEYPSITGSVQSGYFLIDGKAGETIHLGFHAVSPADRFRLYMISVKVSTVDNPVDLKVSEITSPVTGEDLAQEAVTVKVENIGNVDVEAFDVAFDVDGVTVATETVNQPLAKGASMDYTFTAKADLSSPRHKYTIKAYTKHPDDIMTANDTASVSVRHVAPATVPYTMGFEADEETQDIKFFNLNNDEGDWSVYTGSFYYNPARTGYGCLAYNYDKNNNGDDWAMLEPINVEAGYYVLKFWYSGDDNHPEKLRVSWGNEATPEAMTNTIVEYAPFARGAYEESISILHFDKAQTVCIGFYAFSDKDENWITIDDVTFDRITAESTDLMVGGIVNPTDYHRSGNRQHLIYELRNVGLNDTQAKVRVSDGETLLREVEVDVKAQEFKTDTIKGVLSELAAGLHELTVEVVCDGDSDPDNNKLTHSVTVLAEPVAFWDFEDGKVPAEFTYRSEDGGTVNPDAGGEFNEDGIGLISIVDHWLLGDYGLGLTSWIDGADQADRWLVMPKAHIGSGDSWFVWDANSMNQTRLENYQVKVSATEDSQYEYSKELEVTLESITPKTRGISLAEYAGKDVYVAINLRSEICDILLLDNIGFYGDCSFGGTGIDSPAMGRDGFTVSGGVLTAGNAEAIVLRDTGGRTVAIADGGALSIASLAPGVYIATVKTATGQSSCKFVKR